MKKVEDIFWIAAPVAAVLLFAIGAGEPFVGVLCSAAVIAYCSPMIFAYIGEKRNADAIAIINIFLGWTFFGWVLAAAMTAWKEGKK